MNKEEYKKSLHRHYPEEPDNVLELAWHFHGMEKAKKYIKLLETCNHNADLAIKAIRAMYVSCDIDAVKAVSEKFITDPLAELSQCILDSSNGSIINVI